MPCCSNRKRPNCFAEIDAHFGVSKSTGAARATEIRKLFKLSPFAPEWTSPSMMEENPLAWLVEVDGFIVDIRHCPREMQEYAYREGLIPFIPADDSETGKYKALF